MTDSAQRFSPLDPSSTEPIYRQIYWRVRGAIADGVLQPGERVPASRALAKELGLARGTIDTAYTLLTAEGYLQSRGQAGTVVAEGICTKESGSSLSRNNDPGDSVSIRNTPAVLPFQMALPALDAFPRKLWAQTGARCVRSTRMQDMANPSLYGLVSLRMEIARYLQVARGIHCTPAQVFITSGYQNSLTLIAHALLKPGDRVIIEDPGYLPTRQLLSHLGMRGVPMSVDGDGLKFTQGSLLSADAQAAVITPAHQSPLCVSLSLPRRLALLDWANRSKRWIIEDDYDGEYRYVSRPLPALKSLDREGRVVYAGTFSKVLFPGIRIAYLVIPQAQVERFEQVGQSFLGNCPELTQAIVATFMNAGHFSRHIQRMRRLYGERRRLAVEGLCKALGTHITIDQSPGGMHLILHLPAHKSDTDLVEQLNGAGIYAEALSNWRIKNHLGPALLLGFANIATEKDAEYLGKRILQYL